jgi:glucose/arabinose dehydrogenase
LGSNGTVFVGSRSAGNVYALVDLDGDGKSDRTITIASGLDTPNGVAFKNGSLFVAEIDRVIRYDGIESRLENPPSPVVVKEGLPSESAHGWKVIRFGPDEKLYIAIGAPCNICEPVEPQGTISRMNPDGSQFEVYARGIRNSVGFDWSPTTGELMVYR